MDKIIDMLDERISNDYKILEGDNDTIYVVEKETGKHFEIKVTEID